MHYIMKILTSIGKTSSGIAPSPVLTIRKLCLGSFCNGSEPLPKRSAP